MNVYIATERILISPFGPLQPYDTGDDRIPSGRIGPENLSRWSPTLENRASGCSAPDFPGNPHRTQRGIHTPGLVSQAKLGGRNTVTFDWNPLFHDYHSLVSHTYQNLIRRVDLGATAEKKRRQTPKGKQVSPKRK